VRPKGMQYLTTLLGAGVVKSPGLHESATATGKTGSRAQAAGEFARLERERVRLEEKLSMQAVLTAQTEARLDGICTRLEMIRQELDDTPAAVIARSAPAAAPARRSAAAEKAAASKKAASKKASAAARKAAAEKAAAAEAEDDDMEPFEIVPFEY